MTDGNSPEVAKLDVAEQTQSAVGGNNRLLRGAPRPELTRAEIALRRLVQWTFSISGE